MNGCTALGPRTNATPRRDATAGSCAAFGPDSIGPKIAADREGSATVTRGTTPGITKRRAGKHGKLEIDGRVTWLRRSSWCSRPQSRWVAAGAASYNSTGSAGCPWSLGSFPRTGGIASRYAHRRSRASGARRLGGAVHGPVFRAAPHRPARAGRGRAGTSPSAPPACCTRLTSTCRGWDGSRSPDRQHFMAYAARVMRGLIIDYARHRQTQKRGGKFELTSISTDVADNSRQRRRTDRGGRPPSTSWPRSSQQLADVVDLKLFCGIWFRRDRGHEGHLRAHRRSASGRRRASTSTGRCATWPWRSRRDGRPAGHFEATVGAAHPEMRQVRLPLRRDTFRRAGLQACRDRAAWQT